MTDTTSIARWRHVCHLLGIADGEKEHGKLLRAWSGMGRHYHTVEHLCACLHELDSVRDIAEHPEEVEIALWYHDAVYRTYKSNNERKSADWAEQFLIAHGVDGNAIVRIRQSIMATLHAAHDLSGDAALVVDIDLSILGRPEKIYAAFEQNVRREYWWVPKKHYSATRGRILQSFLDRPKIYHWPIFQQRYEVAARKNLAKAIQDLA